MKSASQMLRIVFFSIFTLGFTPLLSSPANAELLSPRGEATKGWDDSLRRLEKNKHLNKIRQEVSDAADKATEALGKVFDLFDQVSIEFSVHSSVNLLRGLGLDVDYDYDVGPAYYGNFFSRIDDFTIGLDLNLLELLKKESGFGVGFNPQVQVRFYQFFENKSEAQKLSSGYHPGRLPFSSEDIFKKLKPTDLVLFDGELNIGYGYTKVWQKVADWFKGSLSAGGVLSGRFRVFLYRGSDSIIRLRVSSVRSHPKFIAARISVFDLFDLGWSRLTDWVESALKIKKLFKGQFQWVDRDLWLADFTLDLKDPRAKSAFDAIFDRDNRFKALLSSANPLTSESDLRDKLYLNLEPLISLANSDQNKANPAATVNFMGANFSNGELFDVEGGVRGAWRGELLSSSKENRLKQTTFDTSGKPTNHYYYYPSWLRSTKTSAGITLLRERKEVTANIIYEADENYNIVKFDTIGMFQEETDKTYTPKEHEKTIEQFRRILPPSVFNDLDNYLKANNWGPFDRDRQNVRVTSHYFINRDGLELALGRSRSEIFPYIMEALQELDDQSGVIVEIRPSSPVVKHKCNGTKLRKLGAKIIDRRYVGELTMQYCRDVEPLARKLEAAFSPKLTFKARNEIFVGLAETELFRKIGPGVLFDIIGNDHRLSDITYLEIVFNAAGQETPVRFSRGEIENKALHEIILELERALNDDEPDMRIP